MNIHHMEINARNEFEQWKKTHMISRLSFVNFMALALPLASSSMLCAEEIPRNANIAHPIHSTRPWLQFHADMIIVTKGDQSWNLSQNL